MRALDPDMDDFIPRRHPTDEFEQRKCQKIEHLTALYVRSEPLGEVADCAKSEMADGYEVFEAARIPEVIEVPQK